MARIIIALAIAAMALLQGQAYSIVPNPSIKPTPTPKVFAGTENNPTVTPTTTPEPTIEPTAKPTNPSTCIQDCKEACEEAGLKWGKDCKQKDCDCQ